MAHKGVEIAPAQGKLGVLLVGLGAVSTTFVAGVEATAVAARRADGSGPEGLVVLLDAATGRPRWQRRVGGEVYPDSLAVGPAGIHLVAQDYLTFEQLTGNTKAVTAT